LELLIIASRRELPKFGTPVANYIPAARVGNIVFLAGTGPMNPDGIRLQGEVGRDVTIEQAAQLARNVGLQLLAALRDATAASTRWSGLAAYSAW
jgi:enamine deaminase RidA (YjgF/YER057c/UK114 family)